MKKPEPTIEDSLHVLNHSSTTLMARGCQYQLIIRDPLIPGPCDVDPRRHLKKRKRDLLASDAEFPDPIGEHWKWVVDNLLDDRAFVRQLNAHSKRHIVLWSSTNFADRLAFWWVLDSLQRNSFARDGVWVAEPKLLRGNNGLSYEFTLGCYSADELKAAFYARRPLTQRMMRVGSSLWRKYAGTSSREFDRACRRRCATFPKLRRETQSYQKFFPQIRASNGFKLELSEFDKILLGSLETKRWRRPIDLIGRDLRLVDFMSLGHDFVPKRLRQFAAHSMTEPIIETELVAQSIDDSMLLPCRLTARGESMLLHGLDTPLDAPPIYLGGSCAYRRNPTWIRSWEGRRSFIGILH